jgi:hypothetical protein
MYNKNVPMFTFNLYHIYDDNDDTIQHEYFIRWIKNEDETHNIHVYRRSFSIIDTYSFLNAPKIDLVNKKNMSIKQRDITYLKNFLYATEDGHYTFLSEYMYKPYIEYILTKTFGSIDCCNSHNDTSVCLDNRP